MKTDIEANFTLDQFTVFVSVVDQHGFAAAARHLGRAQSAITYAIKGLEQETGVQLFDRSGYRPSLIDAGRALLPRDRRLLADLADYRQQAKSFSAGVEAGLAVVVDLFVPVPLVVAALGQVQRDYPSVRVKLIVDAPERPLNCSKVDRLRLEFCLPSSLSEPSCRQSAGRSMTSSRSPRPCIRWQLSTRSHRRTFTATCNSSGSQPKHRPRDRRQGFMHWTGGTSPI